MKEIKKIAIFGIILFHAVMMFIFNMESISMTELLITIGVVLAIDLILSLWQMIGCFRSTRQFALNFGVYALEKVFISLFDYILYYNCSGDNASSKMEILNDALTFSVFSNTCKISMAGIAFVVFVIGLIRLKRNTSLQAA